MNWSTNDHQYMALALQLASKGQYTARPNPMVGCVIVKNDRIIGQGWHQKSGCQHAEINALNNVAESQKKEIAGSTCYVTLEPCSHTGKTGPCAEALIHAGVKKVIAAMQDPNPQVSGKGFSLLNQAGIETQYGLLENQAQNLNQGFVSRFKRKKPWVSLKMAMSLDGRTALENGESQWITGAAARKDVHQLRARQDAIVTGIGTLLADDPSMTVRSEEATDWFSKLEQFEQPCRILLDRKGQASFTDKLLNNNAPVWWVTDNPPEDLQNDSHIQIKATLPLTKLIESCALDGMNHILIEAGHRLAGQFFQQNLVDELIVYMAPKLMGNRAMGLLDLEVAKMQDCPQLELKDLRQFGDDIRLVYQRK